MTNEQETELNGDVKNTINLGFWGKTEQVCETVLKNETKAFVPLLAVFVIGIVAESNPMIYTGFIGMCTTALVGIGALAMSVQATHRISKQKEEQQSPEIVR